MKAFFCDVCGNLVFFENVSCVRCTKALGFVPDSLDLISIEQNKDQLWASLSQTNRGKLFKLCRNGIEHPVCNWLVPQDDPNPLCTACRLNDVIPDLTIPGHLEQWRKLEVAKRRALYTLFLLKLSTKGFAQTNGSPLRFRFLSDPPGGPPVLTGHDRGVITINIAEADDPERERRRVDLREPFRTLLGHVRHEIAHYYWDQLIPGTPNAEPFGKLFGDPSQDYSAALANHYSNGPPLDWSNRCVTAYASSHPWEDWAETWAHYLHIVDTLETAGSFGISLRPRHPSAEIMSASPAKVSPVKSSFDQILDNWLPLTYALNELNRGMGLPDLYPFVLSQPATEKLRFIHFLLHPH